MTKLIPASGELAGRAIPEWIGKTADSKIPPRVTLRVSLRYSRKDAITGLPLVKGFHMDHITPLKDWIATPEYPHGNVEHNLQPVNAAVNTEKAAQENTARAKVTSLQMKALNIKAPPKTKIASAGFPKPAKGDKASRLAASHQKHLEAMQRKAGLA